MSIEERIRAQLITWPGLQGLIGDRVHPVVAPPGGKLPALTYQRISGRREYTNDGASGLAQPRFQITCIGPVYLEVGAILAEARAALEAIEGECEDNPDEYSPDPRTYLRSFDVVLWDDESE